MSSVWYIGLSDVRTITSANWAAVGAPGSDATWNSANGWSIPTTSFTASQLTYLATQSDFATGQPDGPRTGATLAPIPSLAFRGTNPPPDPRAIFIDDTTPAAPVLRVQNNAGSWVNIAGSPPSYTVSTGLAMVGSDIRMQVPVSIANGGTNATDVASARTNLNVPRRGGKTSIGALTGGQELSVLIPDQGSTDVMLQVRALTLTGYSANVVVGQIVARMIDSTHVGIKTDYDYPSGTFEVLYHPLGG